MKLKIKDQYKGLIVTRLTSIGNITLDTNNVPTEHLHSYMNDFSDLIEEVEVKETKVGRPSNGSSMKDKLANL